MRRCDERWHPELNIPSTELEVSEIKLKRKILIVGMAVSSILWVLGMAGSSVSAGYDFPSASMVRAMFERKYAWFQEGSLREQLLIEAEHGNLKIYGFAPDADDEVVASQKGAFFLAIFDDGVFRIRDITQDISIHHSYFRSFEISLPGTDNAFLLTGSNFTHHGLSSYHFISSEGVLLATRAELTDIEMDDSFTFVAIEDAYTGVIPWDTDYEVMNPLGGDMWTSVDVFQTNPYCRRIYVWGEEMAMFNLASSTPVNHYAIAEAFISSLLVEDWQKGATLISKEHSLNVNLELDGALEDYIRSHAPELLDGVLAFQGFHSLNSLRVKTLSGRSIDIMFDLDWDQSYQTARRRFARDHELGLWANPPQITDIRKVPTRLEVLQQRITDSLVALNEERDYLILRYEPDISYDTIPDQFLGQVLSAIYEMMVGESLQFSEWPLEEHDLKSAILFAGPSSQHRPFGVGIVTPRFWYVALLELDSGRYAITDWWKNEAVWRWRYVFEPVHLSNDTIPDLVVSYQGGAGTGVAFGCTVILSLGSEGVEEIWKYDHFESSSLPPSVGPSLLRGASRLFAQDATNNPVIVVNEHQQFQFFDPDGALERTIERDVSTVWKWNPQRRRFFAGEGRLVSAETILDEHDQEINLDVGEPLWIWGFSTLADVPTSLDLPETISVETSQGSSQIPKESAAYDLYMSDGLGGPLMPLLLFQLDDLEDAYQNASFRYSALSDDLDVESTVELERRVARFFEPQEEVDWSEWSVSTDQSKELTLGEALDTMLSTDVLQEHIERLERHNVRLGIMYTDSESHPGYEYITDNDHYNFHVFENHPTHIHTLGFFRVVKADGRVFVDSMYLWPTNDEGLVDITP